MALMINLYPGNNFLIILRAYLVRLSLSYTQSLIYTVAAKSINYYINLPNVVSYSPIKRRVNARTVNAKIY